MRASTASKALADADLASDLAAQVCEASAAARPLRIVGGDTRAFYGRPVAGEALSVAGHRGVIDYDPSELVITARAGTPIVEIEALLATKNQMLAFEPPIFGPASTLGGTVAAGLAGPRRPFSGAVRDAVLGVTVLNGQGESLRLGGTVFKNVAGFDGFRLMAGALGVLGVILDVSLRVGPRPRAEAAVALDLDLAAATRLTTALMRRPLPLTGAAHDGARLHLRFSGGEQAVAVAAAEVGGAADDPAFWTGLRHMTHPFFARPGRLWRLSLPQTAPSPEVAGEMLWDWGGSQRWLVSDEPAAAIREAARKLSGHAVLFRGAGPDDEVFAPLPALLMALHRRIKAGFDPAGVFNPGRMYAEL